MRIKVLFDKDEPDKKLHIGWGLSILVEEDILFDTGENGHWLMENIKNLKVDINKIKTVVISHDHWDHTGGLEELLKKREGLTVYGCPNFSLEFKEKVKKLKGELIEAKKVTEISKDVFITGEIEGEYKGQYMPEQALVIKTKNGITLLTGCAHPGILKILKVVKKIFPKENFYLVMGGFHLIESDKRIIEFIVTEFEKIGVKKVGPTHCSGKKAEEIFKEKYKENFIPIKIGTIIEV